MKPQFTRCKLDEQLFGNSRLRLLVDGSLGVLSHINLIQSLFEASSVLSFYLAVYGLNRFVFDFFWVSLSLLRLSCFPFPCS